jgi:hypothetical protein
MDRDRRALARFCVHRLIGRQEEIKKLTKFGLLMEARFACVRGREFGGLLL